MVPMFEIFTKLRTLFASRNPWPQPERLNPWLDRADAPREILVQLQRGEIDADTARQLTYWHEKGYIVLPKVIDDTRIDRVLNDFDQFYAEGTVIGGHRKHPAKALRRHLLLPIIGYMYS